MTKKIELTRKELTTILQVATGNVKDFVMDSEKFIDEQLEAINYTRCCTEVCESCKQPKEAEAEKYCHYCNSIESI